MKKSLIIAICLIMLLFLVGCNNNDDTSLKCMNCGESIAKDAKFCPQCGETILDSSNDDNKDNNESCSHSWKTATCTLPKTCSKCGETEGNALGHTTTTGVCERCNVRQGWAQDEVKSIIKVYDIFVTDIDSADGVDMTIAWENTSSKTIKYIYFSVEAYNAVHDKVYCEIRDYNVFVGSITGPLEPGYSNLTYNSSKDEYFIDGGWEDCYYNSDIRYFDLTNIRIVYMDNTEIEIGKGWCDYSLSDIPQGLYYTWNDEYNGYEVNYRLKDECADTEITIPSTYKGESVVAISNSTFKGIETIEKINLPETITHIGSYAFADCLNLKYVNIPNKVTVLKSGIFEDCESLKTVDIHNNITRIDSYAFCDCVALKDINIPYSVTNIGEGAFNGCIGLKSITIPNSVTTIGCGAIEGCVNLVSITIPFVGSDATSDENFAYIFGEPSWSYNDSFVPESLKTVVITGGKTIGGFSGSNKIENITIPNSTTIINENAFSDCSSLKTVLMSENIEFIGENAFKNCIALNDIEIPNTVKHIGSFAFSGCSNLIRVKYGNCRYIGNIDNPFLVLISASNLTSEEYIIHNNTKFIMGDAFENCDNMTEIYIPDSVECIGESAFYSCDKLERVIIGDGATKISDWAFANCTSLIEIKMGKSIKSIGFASFMSCESLVSIDIPEGVTEIDNCTFNSCKRLTTVILPDTVENIGYEAFRYCTSLKAIVLGKNIESIGDNAFDLCFNLSDVFYKGDEDSWALITMTNGNYNLTGAAIHYNYPDCCTLESTTYSIEIMDDDYIAYITMIGGSSVVYEIDNTDIVLCEWGDWDGNIISLTFLPISPGQTFVTVYIEGTDVSVQINVTVEAHSHTYTPTIIQPTCTEQGYTTYFCGCGDTYCSNYTEANGHTEVIDKGFDATCTTPGLTEGKHCSVCKEVLVTQEETLALGHTEAIDAAIEPTCTNTGLTEGKHCSICNEILVSQFEVPVKHNYTDYVCTDCGYIYYTEGLSFRFNTLSDSYYVSSYSGTDKDVVIPSTYNNKHVTGIDNEVFENCSSLTSIFIPEGVTSISSWAFINCSSLTSITIPNSVTSIGVHVFYNCSSLQYNKYDNAYYLGNKLNPYLILVKSKDMSITSAEIHKDTRFISSDAFLQCEFLTSITLPKSVITIGQNAFKGCSSLKTVTFEKDSQLTSIGYGVFINCSSLESVTIGNSITSIGGSAFYNCGSLTNIYYAGTKEQWKAIFKGDYNEPLTLATITYNYVLEN